MSTQSSAELNLQQKLREDAQMRVEELEEALLEKDQETQRLQLLVSKLQGEVGVPAGRPGRHHHHRQPAGLLLQLLVLVPGLR